MVTFSTCADLSWPPFDIEKFPVQIREDLLDFVCCPLRPSLHLADFPALKQPPLITVVIPCFNPDPSQFRQLLISLQQQTDDDFNLIFVDDGSSQSSVHALFSLVETVFRSCLIKLRTNCGISAAVNQGVAAVRTPYVAVVDQDDLLHPRAIERLNIYLRAHEGCQFLYSDHICFDDAGEHVAYVPKFSWNLLALLEFNFPIHLTVVATSLWVRSGGMDPSYDGIQDWELYLRFAPQLRSEDVGYIPMPLYAWRLSERSVASSAGPRSELIELARQFVNRAHHTLGLGSTSDQKPCLDHYFFLTEYCSSLKADSTGVQCQGVILADRTLLLDEKGLQASLDSLLATDLSWESLIVVVGDAHSAWCIRNSDAFTPFTDRVEIRVLHELPKIVAGGAPLVVLAAGCRIEPGASLLSVVVWLEGGYCDVLTLPIKGGDDNGSCLHAGFASLANGRAYLPQAQGMSEEAYAADFGSFSHTRSVDAASPLFSIVRSGARDLGLLRLPSQNQSPLDWWSCQVCTWGLSTICLPRPWVHVSVELDRASRGRLLCPTGDDEIWLSSTAWQKRWPWLAQVSVDSLQRQCIKSAIPCRSHPLHTAEFLRPYTSEQAKLLEHPVSKVHHHKQSQILLTKMVELLPKPSIVILTPTELNPRSNGHACLLALAHLLKDSGYTVALLPFYPYRFYRNYYGDLSSEDQSLHFIVHPDETPGSILIVPESAPKSLVNSLRSHFDSVLWWLLAPSGLLTSFKPDIRVNDLLIPFSSFALPDQLRYLFIQPRPNILLLQAYNRFQPQRLQTNTIAIYTGKGRLKPLPKRLHRFLLGYRIKLITRSFPATKADLIILLMNARGLISFDPMTNLSLEAAHLGVPVYLPANPFSQSCFTDFPVDLSQHISDDADLFIQRLADSGRVRKLSPHVLMRQDADVLSTMSLLLASPAASIPFRVTDQLLMDIDTYRKRILDSRTIQVAFDGEALSATLTPLFIKTLKLPYQVHLWLCTFLNVIDHVTEVLNRAGLFVFVRPFIQASGSWIFFFGRLFRRLFPSVFPASRK
jgi:hypothetical protein